MGRVFRTDRDLPGRPLGPKCGKLFSAVTRLLQVNQCSLTGVLLFERFVFNSAGVSNLGIVVCQWPSG